MKEDTNMKWSIKKLNEFSDKIAKLYEDGKIKAPIHLHGCSLDKQPKELIKIFKKIKKNDWILGTWRSHWLWLLSGRSQKELEKQILNGHSMHIYDKNFFTSAIVGGIAPIAVGLAYSLKKKKSKSKVWCFLGDMGASTGIAMESMRYACGHKLPITFIIEDNGLSVRSLTQETWSCGKCKTKNCHLIGKNIERYNYKRKFPHAGSGKFVLF